MNPIYNAAFDLMLIHEGGYQNIYNDRGNWTGGEPGVGVNKGTKYGITAMTYPHLDIKNLTLNDAKAIYKRDFWDAIAGDRLYPALALVAFDTAVNSGVGKAKQFLNQVPNTSLGVTEFLNLRRKYIRSLKLYNVVPTGSRSGKTYGQIWEERISTLARQADNFAVKFPQNAPSRPQEPQEAPSKLSKGYEVHLDLGQGFKELTEDLKNDKLDISRVGNKIYIRVK